MYYMATSARFPPSMWSCSDRTAQGLHRTTNAVEVWHRILKVLVNAKNGFSTVKISDLLNKLLLEERHTAQDAAELQIDPNWQGNKSRTVTNVLKDRRLRKVLENNPVPSNIPFTGIQLLDAISFASSV